MTPQRQRSREAIRSEMIREIARIWNYDESDMAVESFDPLVGMLLGAFATGIEGLHHELQNSRSRIVQRLAKLLTPDVMTGPQPAHAVMRAHVIDPSFDVLPTHPFSCSVGGREIHFSAAGSFTLVNAKIKTVVIQNKIREYGPSSKESFMNQILPGNQCWLGLSVDADLDSFEKLLLFFDWRNDPLRAIHLDQVADIRLFLDQTEISAEPGLPEHYEPGPTTVSSQLHEYVRRYYGRHFLTVSSVSKKTNQPIALNEHRQKCPAALSQGLSPEESAKFFSQELVWLHLQFPESLSDEVTYRTQIEVNAFPVVNRKLCTDTHDIRPLFNVFPVRVEAQESFLEMIDVETTNGIRVSEAQQITRDGQNQYVLRQGGITRFDERDSYDLVSYLITLLRDESAMFMALGRSELESEVDEIRKRLEKINTAIGEGSDQNTFLTVKTTEKNGKLTVRFWSTKGDVANRIPFGTKLSKDRSQIVFSDEESILLTTSTGGKQRLKPDENLPAFRQALLTRGRVVTIEDIKAVCFADLGDKLLSVKVTKGLSTGAMKTQGLIRTMDVLLTPNPARPTPLDQWDDHCHRLKHLIEQQAFAAMPYRVMLEN
ncbi:type VI secretion system baseplate subunit TssF [Spirosoma agri]|uniref:Type VI secretion system baseplate subunit TssF n=1 Tax=Spirosoma agri TaxID=1987381 RepID=A0A6M0IQK8_9BACT|nr:type VI secretion system baseplate subunit TssF [Spirosoma agri]NEU69661.1 hypothetical protein [Spirosoma agri]